PDILREAELQDRDAFPLPDGGTGRLAAGCYRLPWWRRTWTSPERVQMGLLFRLERRGIEAPRVLAEGERPRADGAVDAFLLTRLPQAAPLERWLAFCRDVRRVRGRPDWVEALGEDWPDCVMQAEVTDRFHAKQGRSTGRLVLPRLSVYLKRHYKLSWWRGLLATLWPGKGWSPGVQEFR